jgi:hypothetical protein
MADDGTVNSQITDSVTQVVTLLTGQSPSQSMGMLDAVLLDTLGMAMHNAVNRQQSSHMTSAAAVTAACARMLQVQPPSPPKPPPLPPPQVQPLAGPKDLATDIAANAASAEASVTRLQSDATTAGEDTAAAAAALKKIADMAEPPAAPVTPPKPATT